jgi:hypothetical protein
VRTATLLAITLATATAQSPAPQFEVGLWPGEGRPVFEAVAAELFLREQPSTAAPITERLRVTKGSQVEFGSTIHRTVIPGSLRAITHNSVSGRPLGSIRRLSKDEYYSSKVPQVTLAVSSGTVIEYLQYRAEGTCFIRVWAEVIDADPCPAQNARTFSLDTEPQLEWWIEVLVGNKPLGWLMVDTGSVRQVRRIL